MRPTGLGDAFALNSSTAFVAGASGLGGGGGLGGGTGLGVCAGADLGIDWLSASVAACAAFAVPSAAYGDPIGLTIPAFELPGGPN
mmetsp:Transcript_66406/g.142153  ORF Transcript_66406/g.142153 Transcript_66406/m.142153 type:complete len:86 (-) Transcript_66406:328-585(-)